MRKVIEKTHYVPRTVALVVASTCLMAACQEAKPEATIALPQDEAKFVRIVSTAQADAKTAQNDMQIGGVKAKRDAELCDSGLSYVVNNWVGKLKRVDSNSDGKGVLSVAIAEHVLVKTWNNALSDLIDQTLVEPRTPLFEAASAMQPGQYVTFSGLLLRGSDGDCVKEGSITLKGKVTEPEFIFKFDKISTYSPPGPKGEVAVRQDLARPPVQATAPIVAAASVPSPTPATPPAKSTPKLEEQLPVQSASPQAPQPSSAGSSPDISPNTGPSFDCAKAASVIEQLICKDESLAQLDVQLTQAYKAAAQHVSDKAQLRSEQLDWLKNRRNKCSTAKCITNAYEERLATLRN